MQSSPATNMTKDKKKSGKKGKSRYLGCFVSCCKNQVGSDDENQSSDEDIKKKDRPSMPGASVIPEVVEGDGGSSQEREASEEPSSMVEDVSTAPEKNHDEVEEGDEGSSEENVSREEALYEDDDESAAPPEKRDQVTSKILTSDFLDGLLTFGKRVFGYDKEDDYPNEYNPKREDKPHFDRKPCQVHGSWWEKEGKPGEGPHSDHNEESVAPEENPDETVEGDEVSSEGVEPSEEPISEDEDDPVAQKDKPDDTVKGEEVPSKGEESNKELISVSEDHPVVQVENPDFVVEGDEGSSEGKITNEEPFSGD